MRVGIIGGGIMGLTVAYELSKQGAEIVLFEKQDQLGGLSASFDLGGVQIEKYYHFICMPDVAYFELLRELGLMPRLQWRATKMSYFYKDKLYRWGDPVGLLAFPHLSLVQKIRYAANVLYSKYIDRWRSIEDISAVDWLKGWLGEEAYSILWQDLLHYKFGDYANEISASWIWSRIRRVANSRKGLGQEHDGYLEGGTDLLINTLANKIKSNGGEILLSSPPVEIESDRGEIRGIKCRQQTYRFEKIISTIPLPAFTEIKADLPANYVNQLKQVKNIGIMCLALLLKKALTNNFWLNIKDERIDLAGIIEYTNLNDSSALKDKHVLYMPQYLAITDPKYLEPEAVVFEKYFSWLKIINPALERTDVIAYKLFRDSYAQPIPAKGFSKMLPPINSPLRHLLVADTSFYFPEDRSIDQSILLGKKMARMIAGQKKGVA